MFPFRALEIVLLGRSPHAGYSDADTDRAIAAAALREAGVAHLAERYYNQLSGGERQRVQLARVLAQVHEDGRHAAARYLLLDEPTNNLDPAHQQAVMQTARRFADAGNGVVAVLHDPNLASLHADRIAVLAGGSVVADGAPEAVMTAALMESVYGYRVTVLRHPERACPVLMPA
jgi:iron complex transport system ATP-binding protein